MRNERGEILIILGLVALFLAFAVFVWEVQCDPQTQKCISEKDGLVTITDPQGMPNQVDKQ